MSEGMTERQAIKWLKMFRGNTGMVELSQAFDVAISALEKQIPKMVNYYGDGYADGALVCDMAECPTCGMHYEECDQFWEAKHCLDCGQALMWENQE